MWLDRKTNHRVLPVEHKTGDLKSLLNYSGFISGGTETENNPVKAGLKTHSLQTVMQPQMLSTGCNG